MAGQSRKWMILVATIWIQAFTGTNFDFSAYSSDLKSVLEISQVQLNYLAVASDLGKIFGWSSGLALMYFPLWTVLLAAALMGFVGYGVQWLVITNFLSLPYIMVTSTHPLIQWTPPRAAGLSLVQQVCFVLCISNFPANRSLALSLTVSFNGVSAALYTLAYNAINPTSPELYLLLNALIPLVISFTAIIPILRQPPFEPLPPDGVRRDSLMFLLLNILAALNGVYLLLFESNSSDVTSARLLFGGSIILLILPLCIPGLVIARNWYLRTIHASFRLEGSGFILVDPDELELHKGMLAHEANRESYEDVVQNTVKTIAAEEGGADELLITRGQLEMLGTEHSLRQLLCRADFWLYYIAYFCGGTIGLVYSNNLGQIAQSLGQSSNTTTLVTLYSSFSFFGRLLSATPDYIRAKFYFARTGWLAIALLPTPIALFLLASSGTVSALQAGTALIGLSSGFIFAAAVSITSELFGPNGVGVNHNILITNIPIGSLIYGFLAALIYDSHGSTGIKSMTDSVVCMGRGCYYWTFVWWGCLSVLGLGSSLVLFIRTRRAYQWFEQARISSNIDS
ncbi:hypothetical protein Bca4012_055374 [Brassica carinata]